MEVLGLFHTMYVDEYICIQICTGGLTTPQTCASSSCKTRKGDDFHAFLLGICVYACMCVCVFLFFWRFELGFGKVVFACMYAQIYACPRNAHACFWMHVCILYALYQSEV